MVDRTDRKARRALTHRDRLRTDPRGLPAYAGDDLTPPPAEPPDPESILDYDTIAPPVRERLDQLASAQVQVVSWLGKLGELRDGAWRDRIDTTLVSIARSVTVHETLLGELKPQLDRWRDATEALSTQIPRLLEAVEGITHHVRSIDDRLRTLEREVGMLAERAGGHADALAAAGGREVELSARLDALEQIERDRASAAAALAKVEHRKSRTAGGAAGGVIGAVIAAAIAAIK